MTAKRDFNQLTHAQNPLWNALINASLYVGSSDETAEDKQAAKDHLLAVIRSGVDVNEEGKYEVWDMEDRRYCPGYPFSPLSFTLLFMRDMDIAQELLNHGADINYVDPYGKTIALNVLTYAQPLSTLDFLVDRGADMSIKDRTGMDARAHFDECVARCAKSDNEYVREFGQAYERQVGAALERAAARKPPKPRPPQP